MPDYRAYFVGIDGPFSSTRAEFLPSYPDDATAIEAAKQLQPDVILMDNWIPDAGGIIATQTLKKTDELRNIPVIYFSANSDIQLLASNAGAESYLAKPFDLHQLEQVINKVLINNN